MNVIDSFFGFYRFLSNFYASEFVWRGHTWKSAEHAYQAAKTSKWSEAQRVKSATTSGKAKLFGRAVTLRDGWDDMRDEIMYSILKVKFRDPDLRDKLLATESAELVEGNTWGDTYWGQVDGNGLNKLGKLLMRVREEARAEIAPR